MLLIAVQNRRAHRESLDIAVVRPSPPVNRVLDVAVARRQRLSARLDVGMLNLPRGTFGKRFHGRFAGKHAIGIGDFNVVVRIGNQDVPMCELAETMTITHGENENYRCEFVLRKNRPNGTPKRIDPYQWHTKAVTVHLRHEHGEQILYRGVVDGIQLNALKGTLSVKCSDRRERMINALPWATIRGIGYTSKAIHGEFADKLDELTKRLETVPASFEFDLNQTGFAFYRTHGFGFARPRVNHFAQPCRIREKSLFLVVHFTNRARAAPTCGNACHRGIEYHLDTLPRAAVVQRLDDAAVIAGVGLLGRVKTAVFVVIAIIAAALRRLFVAVRAAAVPVPVAAAPARHVLALLRRCPCNGFRSPKYVAQHLLDMLCAVAHFLPH